MKQAKQSTGGVSIMRMYDPAIAFDEIEADGPFREYVVTRDPALIPKLVRPGAEPVMYHVVKATLVGRRFIRSGASVGDMNERAFAVCVSKVTNWLAENGRRRDVEIDDCDGSAPMRDTVLAMFDEADVQEIGAYARVASFLSRDQPRHFLPPAISWAAARGHTAHLAEQTRALLASNSLQSNESQQEEPAQPPSQPGDEPTAAIAAEK
jgi:hypothetical protein